MKISNNRLVLIVLSVSCVGMIGLTTIKNEQLDRVLEDFTDKVQSQEMTVSSTVVNGVNVNVYTGKLDSDLMGIVCVFKIRDKTALLQTDSSNVFRADFERILSTIRFNS